MIRPWVYRWFLENQTGGGAMRRMFARDTYRKANWVDYLYYLWQDLYGEPRRVNPIWAKPMGRFVVWLRAWREIWEMRPFTPSQERDYQDECARTRWTP